MSVERAHATLHSLAAATHSFPMPTPPLDAAPPPRIATAPTPPPVPAPVLPSHELAAAAAALPPRPPPPLRPPGQPVPATPLPLPGPEPYPNAHWRKPPGQVPQGRLWCYETSSWIDDAYQPDPGRTRWDPRAGNHGRWAEHLGNGAAMQAPERGDRALDLEAGQGATGSPSPGAPGGGPRPYATHPGQRHREEHHYHIRHPAAMEGGPLGQSLLRAVADDSVEAVARAVVHLGPKKAKAKTVARQATEMGYNINESAAATALNDLRLLITEAGAWQRMSPTQRQAAGVRWPSEVQGLQRAVLEMQQANGLWNRTKDAASGASSVSHAAHPFPLLLHNSATDGHHRYGYVADHSLHLAPRGGTTADADASGIRRSGWGSPAAAAPACQRLKLPPPPAPIPTRRAETEPSAGHF